MNQHKVNALESLFCDYLQKGEKGDAKENLQTLLHIGIYQRSPTFLWGERGWFHTYAHCLHQCSFLCLRVHPGSPQAAAWYRAMDWWLGTLVYIILVSM